jgi:ADP-heptose:LPS heptosyltransferase
MQDSPALRVLDRYVGSFICFVFSVVNAFRPRRKPEKIKNVLLIEIFEMGAAVMAYSSVKYLKDELNANICCLCLDKVKDSWALLDIIPQENILAINSRSLLGFVGSAIKQALVLRRKKIDLIIDYELFMRISSIISFLIGSGSRAGFYRYKLEGLYRGTFYDTKCSFNQNSHISKNLLALTKAAVGMADEYPNYKAAIASSEIKVPAYRTHASTRALMTRRIRKMYANYRDNGIILVSPDVGPNLSVRNYPKDYYVEVMKGLLSHYPDFLVLLVGVKENSDVCSYINRGVNNPRCIDFCGETKNLTELLELMCMSRLLIINDNGPAHFAALTNLKVLALFSTDTPFMYGPLGNCVVLYTYFQCSPCISAFNNKNSRCSNNLCLQSIPPETVFRFATRILDGRVSYRTINGETSYL